MIYNTQKLLTFLSLFETPFLIISKYKIQNIEKYIIIFDKKGISVNKNISIKSFLASLLLINLYNNSSFKISLIYDLIQHLLNFSALLQ